MKEESVTVCKTPKANPNHHFIIQVFDTRKNALIFIDECKKWDLFKELTLQESVLIEINIDLKFMLKDTERRCWYEKKGLQSERYKSLSEYLFHKYSDKHELQWTYRILGDIDIRNKTRSHSLLKSLKDKIKS